jgi:AraC-like DNA-binding protein
MPPIQNNQMLEIMPSAPDETVRGLLALPVVRSLPMSAGNQHHGVGAAEEIALIAAVQGNLTVSSHKQYQMLESGQACALAVEGPYTVQSVSDCHCMVAVVRGQLPFQLLEERLESGIALFPRGAAVVREAVMAVSVLAEEHPPVSGELASSYAYTMLMKLHALPAEKEAPFPALVESAIAIIQEDFPFLDGLDDLAERLEISKAHLSRSFVQKTGITPGKYITRVKIEYAKLLLQDESTSISYVAEAAGFANANYFAKVFRRETGMSPSQYLESAPRHRPTVARPLGQDGDRLAVW